MTEAQWRPFCERYLHRLRNHPLWDDIVQEAVLEVWQIHQRYPNHEAAELMRICTAAVWYGAREFLISPRNFYRTRGFHGKPPPYTETSLEMAYEHEAWRAVQPDFAPKLIAFLAARQELARLDFSERDEQLFQLIHVYGLQIGEAARRIGCHPHWAWKLKRRIDARLEAMGGARPSYAGASGFRYVRKERRRYMAYVRIRADWYCCFGLWSTPEEAAIVVDAAILAYGLRTPLNLLPEELRQATPTVNETRMRENRVTAGRKGGARLREMVERGRAAEAHERGEG